MDLCLLTGLVTRLILRSGEAFMRIVPCGRFRAITTIRRLFSGRSGMSRGMGRIWLGRRRSSPEGPSRPIHYEGDYDGRITDIHSRMYLPIEQIHAMCSPGGDVPISDVAVWGHVHQFPLINYEYAHAMGNYRVR